MEKISLIVCRSNDELFHRMLESISQIEVPEGYEIELLEVNSENGELLTACQEGKD